MLVVYVISETQIKIIIEKKKNKEDGGGGIRTHGTLSCTHAFQAGSLSHSDTPPNKKMPMILLHTYKKCQFEIYHLC